jgi:hypothetical protein
MPAKLLRWRRARRLLRRPLHRQLPHPWVAAKEILPVTVSLEQPSPGKFVLKEHSLGCYHVGTPKFNGGQH